MEFKDEEPIKFEFLQSDMEKIMYTLEQIIYVIEKSSLRTTSLYELKKIKRDLQHKIDMHRERKEWI